MGHENSSVLDEVHSKRLRLRHVRAFVRKAMLAVPIRGLALNFDGRIVFVIVNSDDSMAILSQKGREFDEGDMEVIPMDAEEPWDEALGKPLLWSWTMTNNQGYHDGLQFEFAEDVGKRSIKIQLMVEGGGIQIGTVDN